MMGSVVLVMCRLEPKGLQVTALHRHVRGSAGRGCGQKPLSIKTFISALSQQLRAIHCYIACLSLELCQRNSCCTFHFLRRFFFCFWSVSVGFMLNAFADNWLIYHHIKLALASQYFVFGKSFILSDMATWGTMQGNFLLTYIWVRYRKHVFRRNATLRAFCVSSNIISLVETRKVHFSFHLN